MSGSEPSKNLPEGQELVRQVRDYWSSRAPGYTLSTRISYVEETYTMKALGRFINLGKRMRVADMGTGCGLMAMWLASLGHEVVAIDNSEAMLAEAKKNARDAGLDIDFRLGDIQDPDLEPDSFDLVTAKSSVWCLLNPTAAYSNWMDLLRPGGQLAVIDGNYYLHLFDEDYRKRRDYFDMKDGKNTGLHYRTNVGNVDYTIIDELSKALPLPRKRRPTWDVEAMIGVGMSDIHVRSIDRTEYKVLKESGLVKIPSSFIVVGQKPFENMSPHDAAVYEPPVDDDFIPAVTERIRNSGDRELNVMKALADQKRMDIVRALESGRMSTTQLSKVLSASPSLVSHNLSILREQGIVVSERAGKEVLHRLSNPYVLDAILDECNVLLSASEEDD